MRRDEVQASWEIIDEALIRMRRLLEAPATVGESVDLSAVLVVDTIARRKCLGEATRIADIAADLAVKPSTASRLVASTEASGFLNRARNPVDPRSSVLDLTSAGEKLNTSAKEFRISSLKRSKPRWDDAQLAMFSRMLEEFSRAMTIDSGAGPLR